MVVKFVNLQRREWRCYVLVMPRRPQALMVQGDYPIVYGRTGFTQDLSPVMFAPGPPSLGQSERSKASLLQ